MPYTDGQVAAEPISIDPRSLWEFRCPVCWRSSWDGLRDDEDEERCPVCGQHPGLPDA